MADQKSSVTTPKKEPSATEAMFFFAIVKHTRNKADIDWEAVAAEQKFKNAEVAKFDEEMSALVEGDDEAI